MKRRSHSFVKRAKLSKQHLAMEVQINAQLNNLATLYAFMGNYAKAEPIERESIEVLRKHLDLTAAVQSERQQFLTTAQLRFHLDRYLSISDEADTFPDLVYDEVLPWKGAVSIHQLVLRRMRHAAAHSSPEVARQFEGLETASQALARTSLIVPKATEADEHVERLAQLSNQVEELQHDLAQESGEVHEQLGVGKVGAKEVKSTLPPDTALVDFWEYDHLLQSTQKGALRLERRLAAFIVVPQKPVVRVELGPVRADRRGNRLLAQAEHPEARANSKANGYFLLASDQI